MLYFRVLCYGYTGNFSSAIAMQFSEIIALPSQGKSCNPAIYRLYTVRWQYFLIEKLPEHSEFAIFQKMLHCQRKTWYTQKSVR